MSDWWEHTEKQKCPHAYIIPSHFEGICPLFYFHYTEGLPNDEKRWWKENEYKKGPNKKQIGEIEKITSMVDRKWWSAFFEGVSLLRIVGIISKTNSQPCFKGKYSSENQILETPFKWFLCTQASGIHIVSLNCSVFVG